MEYNSNELNRQKLLAGVEAIYGTTSFLSGKELSSAKQPGEQHTPAKRKIITLALCHLF